MLTAFQTKRTTRETPWATDFPRSPPAPATTAPPGSATAAGSTRTACGCKRCIPGYTLIRDEQVARLDDMLARYNANLPPLADFILPAGSRAACQAHVCRTVCRRAERAIVALGKTETLNDHPRQYMNRLSDLMFVLARVLNRHAGGGDVLWEKGRKRS
jgi:cob(I)alamin adenosyltransferase